MPDPIGGIQPFAELARGEATAVYKGYDRAQEQFVLLKTVRAEHGKDADLVARFEEEARLAARVRHPNVVAVRSAGRDGATAYLVAEFVEGLDLGALVRRGPLPPALAAYVLDEAVQGLAAVHAAGVLHRDLKPANLLLSEGGAVKLTDFGLASLAPSGHASGDEVRGTLAYLAPEVVRGEAPGRAADIFSLGAVLAEMLTGRSPFARDSDGATLDAVLHHDPALAADPRIPPAVATLAADLLAKNPEQRSSADTVAKALAPIRARHPVGAEDLAAFIRDPDAYAPRTPAGAQTETGEESDAQEEIGSRSRRPRWRRAASLLALLIVGAAGAWMLARTPADSGTVAEPEPVAAARSEVPDEAPPGETPDEMAVAESSSIDGSEETVGLEELPPTAAESASNAEADALPIDSPEPVAEPDQVAEPETSIAEPRTADPESDDPRTADPGSGEATEPGTLVVAAEPWARVRVDGEAVGTTPLGVLSVPPGRHTVTFENPDFPTHAVEVEVASGAEERVAVSLWSLVARVSVEVSPWAEVTVDGAYWDTVPPQERPLILAPGDHRLAFTHPALGTREVAIRVAAGEVRTVRVNLNEPP